MAQFSKHWHSEWVPSHQASEIGQKPENPVDDIVMLISSESQSGTGPIALLFKVNPIPGVWLEENYG